MLFNGVNTQQFRPDPEAAARERRQLGIDKRVMLYVGRVCDQKGSDVLLQAARLLRERRRDVQLVIAGPIGQFGLKDDPDAGSSASRRSAASISAPSRRAGSPPSTTSPTSS